MKRTKENMFDKRLNYVLTLLMTNGGKTIDIAKLHYRGTMAKKLFEAVRSSLDLMGIEYKNVKGTLYIRVPTEGQLRSEIELAAYFDTPMGKRNWYQGMVQSLKVNRPHAFGIIKIADDHIVDALTYGTGISKMHVGMDYGTKDKSSAAVLVGKTINSIVFDECIDDTKK